MVEYQTTKEIRILEVSVSDDKSDNGIIEEKLVKVVAECHSDAEVKKQETTSDRSSDFVKPKR